MQELCDTAYDISKLQSTKTTFTVTPTEAKYANKALVAAGAAAAASGAKKIEEVISGIATISGAATPAAAAIGSLVPEVPVVKPGKYTTYNYILGDTHGSGYNVANITVTTGPKGSALNGVQSYCVDPSATYVQELIRNHP